MFSPSCSLRRRAPASILSAAENGGILISPAIQMSGLPSFATNIEYVASDIDSMALSGVRTMASNGRAQWVTVVKNGPVRRRGKARQHTQIETDR